VNESRGQVGLQILLLGLIFVALGVCTDGLYALGAGTAAGWLKAKPRVLRSERWISGSMYIGLGVAAGLSGGQRK
jgi:threonine/homoserine/homoserine lactone efflux protein